MAGAIASYRRGMKRMGQPVIDTDTAVRRQSALAFRRLRQMLKNTILPAAGYVADESYILFVLTCGFSFRCN